MRTVICSDTHGRDDWKKIVDQEGTDVLYIFIGDYFDSFDIPADVQIENFLDIVQFKKDNLLTVSLLSGNHDFLQYDHIGGTCSGYQTKYAMQIKEVLNDNRDMIQAADSISSNGIEYLVTHAGVGIPWMDKNHVDWDELSLPEIVSNINDVWKYRPDAFLFDGRDGYGDDTSQTPMWIRPESLSKVMLPFNQIVGHTHRMSIQTMKVGDYSIFITDSPDSKEYLVILEDGSPQIKTFN